MLFRVVPNNVIRPVPWHVLKEKNDSAVTATCGRIAEIIPFVEMWERDRNVLDICQKCKKRMDGNGQEETAT